MQPVSSRFRHHFCDGVAVGLPEKVQVRLEEKVAKREVRRREKEAPLDDSVEGNQQLNKASKAEFKKGKKGRAKQEKRIAKLADHMVESLAGLGSSLPKDKSMDSATKGADDSYDFESDFGLPTR
ncbi:unnamed protein product [Cyprideis torosa]|uniref:Uncharacterized protein n=1 Tax=Cyprideis torosa TaxID=163714 RepID=A0A7R8ZSN4_9CRUS|nr:unnamed protein product [Cyprideis torosa]CAG0895920.1 unnamed protein product [Cyprideis torosa]